MATKGKHVYRKTVEDKREILERMSNKICEQQIGTKEIERSTERRRTRQKHVDNEIKIRCALAKFGKG